MIMDEFLTAKDRIALKKLPLTLRLRKKNACLILLGVDTVELGDAFTQYLLKSLEGEDHVFHIPATELILPEIIDPENRLPLAGYIIIKLYDRSLSEVEKEKISAGLLLYRDYIPEYHLKLLFILSHDLMSHLQAQAYDFFSFNHYSRFFYDHQYRYKRAGKENEKLLLLMEELDTYLSGRKKKKNIIIEKTFSIITEAYEKSEIDIALEYSHRLSELADKKTDKFYIAAAQSYMGLIYSDKGDAYQALKYHLEALEIHKELGYKQGEASDLGNIGAIYITKGDADQALKYLKEALEIHKEIGDKQGEASDLGNIGVIYSDKGDADQALKYHLEALEIYKDIGYKQGEANQLRNIGLIYISKGDADQALKYLKEALEIHKEIGYKEGEASDLGNIGLIYRSKGDTDQALKRLNEAIEIAKQHGFKPLEEKYSLRLEELKTGGSKQIE